MSNFNSVISNLSSQYDIDGPYDLTNFFQEGDKWLYDFLKDHYKEEYAPNYRLVLYFDTDYYPYVNAPGTLVTKLQQYLMDLDISHFFVILLTSDKRIKEDLETIKLSYKDSIRKPDSVPITYINVQGIRKYVHHDNKRTSTICMKLWNHFHVHTTGEIFPCCVANHKYPLGDILHMSPNDIMNSSITTEIREAMLHNDAVVQCSECYNKEDAGLKSMRIVPTEAELVHILHNTSKDGIVSKYSPTNFDIRFSNICNLKCLMCTGSYSSKIASEEKEIHSVKYQTLVLHDKRDKFKDIMNIMDDIKSIYFAGGEPLIMEEHYKILEHLNNDVHLAYNTNFTTLQYKGIDVIDFWNRFSNVKVGASLDASYAHAEYIRNGTIWNDIISNYKILKEACPHVDFRVTSNVNIYNIFNLIEFQREWIDKHLLTADKFEMMILTNPEFLNIQVLPAIYKKKGKQKIIEHIAYLDDIKYGDILIKRWLQVQNFMIQEDKSFLIPQFFQYTDEKDRVRNTSFDDVLIEYNGLRNYNG